MDITAITQAISSLGFPIFISIYLIHYMEEEQKGMKETIEDLREAITILTERLGGSGTYN